jgi:hypothetical protein
MSGRRNLVDFAAPAGGLTPERGARPSLYDKKINGSGIYDAFGAPAGRRRLVKEWPPSHRNCGICITTIHKLCRILPYLLTNSRECWY